MVSSNINITTILKYLQYLPYKTTTQWNYILIICVYGLYIIDWLCNKHLKYKKLGTSDKTMILNANALKFLPSIYKSSEIFSKTKKMIF